MKKNYLSGFILLIFFIFLYLPIENIIYQSFIINNKISFIGYKNFFHNSKLLLHLLHSILLSLCVSIISIGISLCTIKFFFLENKTSNITLKISLLSLIIPEVVLAIALFIFFNYCKISLGYTTLLISHISLILGYIIPLITIKWDEINTKYFRIAYNLGATKEETWRSIILPLLQPTLLGLFCFSFIISFNDYIFFYFCSATDTKIITSPLLGILKNGLNQEAKALYTVLFLISIIFILTYHLYGYYYEIKK